MTIRTRSQWWMVLVGILVIALSSCASIPKPKPQSNKKPQTSKKPAASQAAEADKFVSAGKSQLEAGSLNKAIASFEKALKTDPKNAEAARYLKQAEQKKAATIDDHVRQGIKYFSNEQLEQAMKEWDKALALDPKHAKALDYKKRTQDRLNTLKK